MFKKVAQAALLCSGIFLSIQCYAMNTDIHGIIQNNIYNNSTIGFTLKFPEDWTTTTVHTPHDSLITEDKATTSLADEVKSDGIFLFNANLNPECTISANAYAMSNTDKEEITSDSELLKNIKFVLVKSKIVNEDAIGPVEHTQLGRLNVASFTITINNKNKVVKQTLYAAIHQNYILFFTTTYRTKEQQNMLQNIFNTLLFY